MNISCCSSMNIHEDSLFCVSFGPETKDNIWKHDSVNRLIISVLLSDSQIPPSVIEWVNKDRRLCHDSYIITNFVSRTVMWMLLYKPLQTILHFLNYRVKVYCYADRIHSLMRFTVLELVLCEVVFTYWIPDTRFRLLLQWLQPSY